MKNAFITAGMSVLLAVATITASTSSYARGGICEAIFHCEGELECLNVEVFGGLALSTTFGPFGTTTFMECMDSAELDSTMIEREAIMVSEENRLPLPSHLASYADQIGATNIQDAAAHVLRHGVQH